MAKATIDQLGELVQQVKSEQLSREVVQAIIEGRFTVQRGAGTGRDPSLAESLAELAPEAGAATTPTGEFANEEVPSTYGYPSGWRLKPPAEQARLLVGHFPGLDVSHVEHLAMGMEVPPGFDGIGVVPKLSVLAARDDKRGHRTWPVLNRALAVFLPVIGSARRDFKNYMGDNIGPEHLRLWNGVAATIIELESGTVGDCIVLPVQTGIRHRGKSPRRARVVFTQNEFGSDPVTMGCLVLTHPERLQDKNILWIDCPGAEYAPDSGGQFTNVPIWSWSGGRLRLSWDWVDGTHGRYGSASALRPGVLPSNLGSSAPPSTRSRSAVGKGVEKKFGLLEF